jgi:hypothetical protein
VASSFTGGTFVTDPDSGLVTVQPADPSHWDPDHPFDDGISTSSGWWHDPDTGVVMCRPNIFSDDIKTNPDWHDSFIRLEDLFVNTSELELLEAPDTFGGEPSLFITTRPPGDAALTGIAPPPGYSGLGLDKIGLVTVAMTQNPLNNNEGWAVQVNSAGTIADGNPALICVMYGAIWAIVVKLSSVAELYQNIGTQANQNFVKRETFNLTAAGIDMGKPFMVSCIPNGVDAMSFAFSQAAQGDTSTKTAAKAMMHRNFHYECRKHGFDPPKLSRQQPDGSPEYLRKITGAAALAIAVPKTTYNVDFCPILVRYKACNITLCAEVLDEPKPNSTPEVGEDGINRQSPDGSRSSIVPSFTNDQTNAWTPATDTKLVLQYALTPTDDGRYTPEIWGSTIAIAPEIFTPDPDTWPTWDISSLWRKISGRLSTKPDVGMLEMMWDRSGDTDNLFRADGPIIVKRNGFTVFEGDALHLRPNHDGSVGVIQTLEGGEKVPKHNVIYTDESEFEDLWRCLNRTSAAHFQSLNNKAYGAVILDCITRSGFAAGTVSIDPVLMNLFIQGFESANDWKNMASDVKCGDVLRSLFKHYGCQSKTGDQRTIRLVRRNSIPNGVAAISDIGVGWYCYLTPEYDPTVVPTKVFFTADACVPERESDGATMQDDDRWNAVDGTYYYNVSGKLEPTMRGAQYNNLKMIGASGSGPGADGFTAFIAPDPATLLPSSIDFQNGYLSETIGPPHTAMASTAGELEIMARTEYARDGVAYRGYLFDAEWQLPTWVDDFIMLVMIATKDSPWDSGATYKLGDPVSLGAYLIDEIAWETTVDGTPAGDDPRSYANLAKFTAVYVGETTSMAYPMFTKNTPAIGRAS